jgi:hypothetical protein
MRTTVLYPPLYRQTRTLSEFNERLASESSTINSSALTLEGGGGSGTPLVTEVLQTLSEEIIANDVPVNVSTAIILKEYPVPKGMKGKTGLFTGYFYLKNQVPWGSNMTMNYGFALDNAPLETINNKLPFYRQIVTTDNFALATTGPTILGRGGFTQRVTIPITVPKDATAFSAAVTNSSVPLATTQVGAVATTILTFTSAVVRTYTVPANVTNLTVHIWGAGGNRWRDGTAGGGGSAYVTGQISVVPGQILYIIIGNRNGGSSLLNGGSGTGVEASNGGGFTGIFNQNVTGFAEVAAFAAMIACAGGGGAGGVNSVNRGGGGGYINGLNAAGGGSGGTQTAGGAGNPAGQLLRGGSTFGNSGGGGGGGYYGGGAGGGNAGGGGGSSFVGGLVFPSGENGQTPPSGGTTGICGGDAVMKSFFGSSAQIGYTSQNGAVVIITEGIYPTFIGSEIKCLY